MQYNYDDTEDDEDTTPIPYILETKEERIRRENKRIAELQSAVKASNRELRCIFSTRGNPEDLNKLLDITTEVAQNVLTSEITDDNFKEAPFNTLNEEDMEFYDDQKYRQVSGLHNKLLKDSVVSEGLVELKQTGRLNSQTQWRVKKPNDWIGRVVEAKRNAHNDARLAALEEQVAKLALAQKETDNKVEQLGNAVLLHETKIDALLTLGVAPKKVEAYRLSLARPELTRQELADELGKSKPTVIKWLQEIRLQIEKSTSHQAQ